MRTEKEIRDMITFVEDIYPEGKDASMSNPIVAYELGILAGLKSAVGDYPSFMEIDLEDFMNSTFTSAKRTDEA